MLRRMRATSLLGIRPRRGGGLTARRALFYDRRGGERRCAFTRFWPMHAAAIWRRSRHLSRAPPQKGRPMFVRVGRSFVDEMMQGL